MKSPRAKQVAIGIAVLAPILYLSSGLKPWDRQTLPLILQEIIYPVQWSGYVVKKWISEASENYLFSYNAVIENRKLRKEVAIMRAKTLDYDELKLKHQRLRDMLGFRSSQSQSMLVSEVIAGKNWQSFSTVRLSRGSQDSVRVGMPVVNENGVIGKVFRVGLHHSDVLSLADPNFYLDSLIQRTRVRGILHGIGGNKAEMQLSRHTDVRIGDVIQTSGLVGSFPKGLVIGKVVKIAYASDKASQFVTIEPEVDVSRVEEAFIILENDRYVEQILETAGSEWLQDTLGHGG